MKKMNVTTAVIRSESYHSGNQRWKLPQR